MKKKQISYLNVMMNNIPLKRVNEHTHLGITLNTNLTWDNHGEKIAGKAGKRVDCLKRIKSMIP